MVFGVGDEVAVPLELAGVSGCLLEQGGFDFRGDGGYGIGIDHGEETALGSIGIFDGEKPVVEADFGIGGSGDIDPVDRGLADDAFWGVISGGVREEFGADEGDFAGIVFLETNALDDGAATEADVFVRGEAEVFFLGDFLEVLAFDEDFAGERDLALSEGFVLWVVGDGETGAWFFRVIFDYDFQWIEHGHAAGCGGIEVIADVVFQ